MKDQSPAKWKDADAVIPQVPLSGFTSVPMRLLMNALAHQQGRFLGEWLEDHMRRTLFELLDESAQEASFVPTPAAPPQSDFLSPHDFSDDPPSDERFWQLVQARSAEISAAIDRLESMLSRLRNGAHQLWTGQLPKFTHLTESDGKREWLSKLEQRGPYREFFRVRPAHLRKVEELLVDAPNLRSATRFLLSQLKVASRSRTGLSNLPRILLVGPPAAGKTWWAEQVAAALGLRASHLSMPCVTANFELSGNTSQWSCAKPGQIVRAFLETDSASPIIILDEIDKVLKYNSNPPGNTLLNLIERSSAIRWRDEFYDREFDVSTAIIIATANDPALIDPPLLSRFHRIDVSVPQRDQLPAMVRSVWRQYRKLRADLSLQRDLDEGVVQRIAAKTQDARSVTRMLDEAIGRAVERGRHIRIAEDDVGTGHQGARGPASVIHDARPLAMRRAVALHSLRCAPVPQRSTGGPVPHGLSQAPVAVRTRHGAPPTQLGISPMSPELQDQLSAKYPKIFSNIPDPALPPSCSLDCGDGRYWLIERLCHCVQDLVDQRGVTQHVAQHVKEKFGGLRFYWYFSDDQVDAMTELAEALSHFVCGDCGAPAVRNTDGWIHTTCVACQSAATAEHQRTIETTSGAITRFDYQRALWAKYPKIFGESVDGMPRPVCAIACGSGWYRLIERLCACVQSLADHQHLPQPRAAQVKEKLGGLRFYWEGVSDERVAAMTQFAESLSLHMCEVCGAPGALVRELWLRTRCERHRETRA